jgi:hypothetical protein
MRRALWRGTCPPNAAEFSQESDQDAACGAGSRASIRWGETALPSEQEPGVPAEAFAFDEKKLNYS